MDLMNRISKAFEYINNECDTIVTTSLMYI